jgi:uncharacterized protein (TIRG00374 family)
VALAPAGLIARAYRWEYLFPPRSNPPGLLPAIMIGYMVNNVLPLRAGEVVRLYVVSRRWGHGFWTAAATVVVERVLDSLSIVAVLATVVLLSPARMPTTIVWLATVLVAIDAVGVIVLVAVATAPTQTRRALERLARRWPGVRDRAVTIFDTFVRGLDGIRTPRHLLPIAAWTIVVWIIPAMAAWSAMRAVDLDLPWLAGWAALAFVGLGVSVPAAPGYFGAFHAAAKEAVGLFGVSATLGAGYALLFHATQYIPVTVLGWIFLLREQMTLGEASRVSAREAETAPPSR